MADVPFATFAFPLSSVVATATTTRTLPTRLSDIVNVLDYGADPTYTTDATTSIQAAFDAAFGTAASPHGLTNASLNKAVFFPNGRYKLWGGPVVLNQVYGGHIFGAGRGAVILDGGNGANVLRTNGMSRTCIEGISFVTRGTGGIAGGVGINIDLDWDNSNPAGAVGLKDNIFRDLHIDSGLYGIRIGNQGHGGSNNIFQSCFIVNAVGTAGGPGDGSGIATTGAEAVGNVVIGGNSQFNSIGINAVAGGFSLIQGLSAQNFNSNPGVNDGVDIFLGTSSVGPTVISGVRAEGPTFLKALSLTQAVVVSGCNSTGAAPHGPLHFVEAHGPCTIEACTIDQSDILAREAAMLTIRQCWFQLANSGGTGPTVFLDALASSLWFTPTNIYSANIELEGITTGNPVSNLFLKQRRYTTNGTSITTKNYDVI